MELPGPDWRWQGGWGREGAPAQCFIGALTESGASPGSLLKPRACAPARHGAAWLPSAKVRDLLPHDLPREQPHGKEPPWKVTRKAPGLPGASCLFWGTSHRGDPGAAVQAPGAAGKAPALPFTGTGPAAGPPPPPPDRTAGGRTAWLVWAAKAPRGSGNVHSRTTKAPAGSLLGIY